MWRAVMVVFLVAHGLVHLAVWNTPKPDEPKGFDPSHSWALGDGSAAKTVAGSLAVAAAVSFVVAGVALALGSGAWVAFTAIGACIGLTVSVLFFNPWLTFDVAMNAWLLYAAVAGAWPVTAF